MRARIHRVFFTENGLRVGWRAALSVAAMLAAYYGLLNGLAAIFGALFDAWGLTQANLLRAPVWAQQVVRWHSDLCYGLAYLAAILVGSALAKRWAAPVVRFSRKALAVGAGIGLMLSGVLAALALVLDSVRMENPASEAYFSLAQVTALIVLTLGKLMAEVLTKRAIFDSFRLKSRVLAWIMACAAAMILNLSALSVLSVLNALLLGIVGCALYERGGLVASASLSVVMTAIVSLMFGFPGMSASAKPIWMLYSVSEEWLTGGEVGILGGFWAMAVLLFSAAALLWPEWKKICFLRRKKR